MLPVYDGAKLFLIVHLSCCSLSSFFPFFNSYLHVLQKFLTGQGYYHCSIIMLCYRMDKFNAKMFPLCLHYCCTLLGAAYSFFFHFFK
jgi:hypothetical protein